MKKIKIFLASSIEDLKDDRLFVGDFFRQLNEIYIDSGVHFSLIKCEDYDNSIATGGKQSQYDKEIRDSELCFFLFYRKAGEYTKHEFEVALEAFKGEGKPKIITYFKTVQTENEVYEDVAAFMERLSTELNHYYNKYDHIDTLKLGILMQIKMLKLDSSEIALTDGEIKVNGQALIKAENVPMLKGNKTLDELTRRKKELGASLDEARKLYLANPSEENESLFFDASAELNKVSKQLTEIEKQAMSFVSTVFEITSDGRILTQRQKQALEYFNKGDYDSAQLILEDAERENELERAKNRHEQGKNEIQGYINEDLLWIKAEKAREIDITDLFDWKRTKAIIEKCEKVLTLSREYNLDLDKEFMYSYVYSCNFGRFFCCNFYSDYEKLEKYYLWATEIYERLSKKNPDEYVPVLAFCYFELGALYNDINDHEKAEKYKLLATEIRERLAKKNPDAYEPDLAASYTNIGVLYSDIKDYEKSEKYHLLATEIYERLAKKNPDAYELDLAMSYNNIGNLYSDIKDYEKSEKYHLLAIEIYERLENKNPNAFESGLALSYNNIGNLYSDIKDYEKSEKYHLLAIEIYEESPDVYEPALAASYYDIGTLYRSINDYEKSEKYYLLAIDIIERLVKKNPDAHEPDLATCYNSLAITYKIHKDFEKNEKYELLAFDIIERLAKKNPGAYEPDLADRYGSLGFLYYDINDYKKAEKYFLSEIEIKEKLAKKEPDEYEHDLAASYSFLSFMHENIKDYEKAEKYYLLEIGIYESLTKKNPDEYERYLATSYSFLGTMYENIKNYEKAEKYKLLADEIFKKLEE
ncbi:MAG: tetratricopeptide repeat protein [Clostridia bacterium]|nr:tetratricopeptide repeat protein [Clostridia bacterium]